MESVSFRIRTALDSLVTDVFGVMGNGNAYFVDALATAVAPSSLPLRYTAVRHEAGTVAAADAYFRSCGRIAVATTTYGAGFSNALTALAEAVRAQIPLLLVTGAEPTTGAREWDIDQAAAAAALGAVTFTVGRSDVERTTVAAFEHARDNRTPVVLAIPYDLANAPADGVPSAGGAVVPGPEAAVSGTPAWGSMLAVAADLLATAHRPLVLAGRGAWLAGAGAPLARLAALLHAPTATTALAAGLFDDEACDLGIAGGFSSERAAEVMADADVVLIAGARLNPFTMRFGELLHPAATLIQIDLAEFATHPSVTTFLRGDARLASEALLAELAGRTISSTWREELGDIASGAHGRRDPGDELAADGRLDPRRVALRLGEILPDDKTVVQDGGHFIGWAPSYWRFRSPNRLVMVGTAYQSIGLGFPSAVGAAVGLPGTTLVVSTGDGGALMALSELETVVRTTRRGVIVVWNDAAYGAEVHQYGSRGLDTAAMLIPQVDFVALATALGARGATIRSLADLDVLSTWLDSEEEGVFLVDCVISSEIIAPYMRELVGSSAR